MITNNPSPAENLYYSVWKTVFGFLETDEKDLLSCRQVCKTLQKYADKYMDEIIYQKETALKQEFALKNSRFPNLRIEDQIKIMNIICTVYHSNEMLNKINGYEFVIMSQFFENLSADTLKILSIFVSIISDETEDQMMDPQAGNNYCREVLNNICLHRKILSTFTLDKITLKKLQTLEFSDIQEIDEGFQTLKILLRWSWAIKECVQERLNLSPSSREILDQMDVEVGKKSIGLRRFIRRRHYFNNKKIENNYSDHILLE